LPHLTGDNPAVLISAFRHQHGDATAYDIIRQCGVEIGKRDFMGPPPS
jgi:hypothetical protein